MSKLRSKFIAVLAVLFCALLALSMALFIPKNEKVVEANTINSSYNVGELIASGTGSDFKFSGDNLATLYKNLTGKADKAVFSEVEKLVANGDSRTAVLSAQQISSKAGGEYTVIFAGKEWIPTYLSKADNGNVILTLWLAQSSSDTGSGVKLTGHTTRQSVVADGKYTSGLYSSSYARAYMTGYDYSDSYTTLNGNGAAIQNAFWKSFVQNYGSYMVEPINVDWQAGQSAAADLTYKETNKHDVHVFPNESCKDPYVYGEGWATNNKGTTTLGAGTGAYYHWGNDKIWLPSLTETGDKVKTIGIWKTSDNQLKNSDGNTLLRSGAGGSSGNCYVLDSDGAMQIAGTTESSFYCDITTLKGGIRPAFHLNLTAAKANVDKTALPVPSTSITTVYNGSERTLSGTDGLAAEKDDNAPWYYANLYTLANITEGEKDSKTVQNAGNYDITLKIGNTDQYKWYGSTEDTQSFKLTIEKKKVKVKFMKGSSNSTFTDGGSVISGTDNGYPKAVWDGTQIASVDNNTDKCPELKTKYQGTGGTPTPDDPYTEPIIKGNYKAIAELEYKETAEAQNYIFDPDGTTEISFKVTPVGITEPTLGNTNLTYNGTEQTVTVSGLPANNDNSDNTIVTYTVKKDGEVVTVGENKLENLTAGSFKVIDAGTYTVTFSIVSAKKDTHVWKDEDNSDDLTLPSFTVAKKRIRLYFDGSSDLNSESWTVGMEINFSVNLNNDVCTRNGETEKVVLYVYYTNKDGTGSTEAPDQGNYTYILPNTLAIGSNYKLYCKLAENQAVNANYVIEKDGQEAESIYKSFEITAADAAFKKSNLKWQYKNADIEGNQPQYFGESNRVTFNGKTYTISLDTSNLADLGVTVDTEFEGFNKGFDGVMSEMNASSTAYVISVRIKALGDYNFEAQTYTFEWFIDKADFELSSTDIKWQYTARGDDKDFPKDEGGQVKYEVPYEGGGTNGTIVVFISGLPSELTAEYDQAQGNSGSDIASYITKIIKLKSSDDNYNDVTDFSSYTWATLNWQIVKHILPTESERWSAVDYADGQVTEAPTLSTSPYNNVHLVYKYYDNYDNAKNNGADIAFADLKYTEGTEKTYYVKAFIDSNYPDDVKNWGLDETSNESNNPHKFVVGANRDAVEIKVTAGGVYDGTPKGAKIEFVGTYDEITLDSFAITYYNAAGEALTGAPTDVGTYTVKIALTGDLGDKYFIKDNKDHEFEITTRVLEVPKYEGSLTYNGEEQDIAKLVGLPDGWENYLEITLNGNSSNGKVKDAGTYNISFKIKEYDIAAGNVAWNTTDASQKTLPRTLKLNVNQLVLHAKKWTKNGYYTAIEFQEENGNKFVTYTVKDANGNLVTEAEFYAHPDDEYVIEVSVGEEHGENVRIEYAAGVNPQLKFKGSSTDEDDAAELESKKKAAKEELEKAAAAKRDEIDKSDMTDEEKAEAKKKVEAELAKGLDEIDKATNTDDVDKAESAAKGEIEKIQIVTKSSPFPWWIIAVVAGVLALAAVLIIVIVKRRQTADGDDDYDDFYDDEYDFDEDIEEEYDDGEDFGEDF